MRLSILLFTIICPFIAPGQLEKGLVAHYSFNDGIAQDERSGGMARAVGVSFVDDRFGNKKSSCFLHGNNTSYINLGTGAELKPLRGTISLWVKIDVPMYGGQGYSVNPIILVKNGPGDDFFEAYSISYQYVVQKLVVATTRSELQQLTIHSTEIFTLNEWHHVALTWDDDFTCLYVDGKLDTKMPKNFRTEFLENDSLMIGHSANAKNMRFLCGSVDDVLIYDRVLAPDEIRQLYEAPDPDRSHKLLAWLLRAAILVSVIGLIMWFILRHYRKDLEKQKERNRIEGLLNDLETKAIRTQMNPHFIFNALNTLQSFILDEDTPNANLYLTKFSSLLRRLIETSVSDSICLAEEIDILNKYVELEKMRFENSFEYNIICAVPDAMTMYVPFMMVQPFVENAIWHGLLPKKTICLLTVRFSRLDANRILCIVDDNGVGRLKTSQGRPHKTKSLALDFIRQRLELLEKSTGIACGFRIVDKVNQDGGSQGTRVEIIIPILKPDVTFDHHRRRAASSQRA